MCDVGQLRPQNYVPHSSMGPGSQVIYSLEQIYLEEKCLCRNNICWIQWWGLSSGRYCWLHWPDTLWCNSLEDWVPVDEIYRFCNSLEDWVPVDEIYSFCNSLEDWVPVDEIYSFCNSLEDWVPVDEIYSFCNSLEDWVPVDEIYRCQSSNELQRLESKNGQQDRSPSNGHQGDRPIVANLLLPRVHPNFLLKFEAISI